MEGPNYHNRPEDLMLTYLYIDDRDDIWECRVTEHGKVIGICTTDITRSMLHSDSREGLALAIEALGKLGG
jgi:hypothetical protein